jgi:hypothetical protein
MARFQSAEIPALHRAGKTAADRDARDVDLLARHEMISLDQVAHIEQVRRIDAEFRELLFRLDFSLPRNVRDRPWSISSSSQSRNRAGRPNSHPFLGALRHDLTAIELQDRDGHMTAVLQKEAGHADLLRDDASAHRACTP